MKSTLYSENLDDTFLKPLDIEIPSKDSLLASNYFYIKNFKKANKYFLYNFELYKSYIIVKKSQNDPPLAYMNVENCFMRIIQSAWRDNKKIIGIKFFKKKVIEEIFHEDKSVVKKWFNLLKKHCILVKFRNYFDDVKVIGNGNFAKVYLVERMNTKRQFAVKVFDKNLFMNDKNEKECILNEIHILKNIDHKNLLKLEEIYEGENHVYCLCRNYEGINLLESLIKNGMPDLKETINIIKQILKGVEYLASLNIIHRDIKPENIIYIEDKEKKENNENLQNGKTLQNEKINENGELINNGNDNTKTENREEKDKNKVNIVLVDFGFATYEKDYNKLFTRCGTPGFVAPEILQDKNYDKKVDVYSIGIIFYLLLSGDIPFDSESYRDMVFLNTQGKIDYSILFKMKVPDKILFLIKKMLEIYPEDRFSAVECLEFLEKEIIFEDDEKFGVKSETFLQYDNKMERISNKQKMSDRTRDLSPLIKNEISNENNLNFY